MKLVAKFFDRMLNFFPTLYLDELWYSVLCRYHIRCGNKKNQTTIQNLFSGKTHAGMGSFFPNKPMKDIIDQLPKGLLDITEVILNHFLFPYYYRIQPYEKKVAMLDDLKDGRAVTPTNLRNSTDNELAVLKLCPNRKSERKPGESYWHVSHQTPLVRVCHEHKCLLISYSCSRKKQLDEDFILPNHYKGEIAINYDVKAYENRLTNTLHDYLHMPLEVGSTPGYNNLVEALIGAGYGMMRQRQRPSINSEQLYLDLNRFYGSDIIE